MYHSLALCSLSLLYPNVNHRSNLKWKSFFATPSRTSVNRATS